MLAGALALAGCSGEDTVPDDTADPSLSVPPVENEEVGEGDGDVLELDEMSDEELLAEAERAYQGFLDDLEELRSLGSNDYMSLTSWATESYLRGVERIYVTDFPEGITVSGAQRLLGIELSQPDDDQAAGTLNATVCLDNTSLIFTDQDGEQVIQPDAPERSAGVVTFLLSEDQAHLQIDQEELLTEVSEELCVL
ncbi:MAG TPA: hypothetical protein H9830_13565 [Candidatus Agrococcus pullicola]|uniref:Uncharacterized protein n=1 Tax=Candidatus Agrococcus pullicola TaxID=2838429 RepID=A0A9D2CAG3_9MICO|nr:hypothetical protein [Candidatus Agrococcus pullicola]